MMHLPSKLKTIFRLQLLIAGYLPVSVLSLYIFIQVKDSLRTQIQNNITATSQHASALIQTFLFRVSSDLKVISRLYNGNDTSTDQGNNLLYASKLYRHFENLTLLNHNGNILFSTSNSLPERTLKNDLLPKLKLGKMCVSDVLFSPKRNRFIFYIGIPNLEENEFKNALIAEVNLKTVWHLLHTIHFGKTGKLILLNQQGQYIGGVHENKIFKEFQPQSIKLQILYQKVRFIEFVSTDKEQLVAGISYMGGENQTMLFPSWKILLIQNQNESYFIIRMIGKYLMFLLPLTLFIIFFLTRFFLNQVLTPLSILLKGTQKVAAGDLAFKTQIPSNNEIGTLSHNFDIMIEQVNSAQKSLKNEILEKEEAKKQVMELNRKLEQKVEQRTKEILELKEFHQNILNSITSGVLVIDCEKNVQFLNPAGEILLKVSFEKIRGKNISAIGFPNPFNDILIKSLKDNVNIEALEINFFADSRKKDFGIKTSVLNQIEKISGVIAIFNDISERKRMENELIQSEKMFSCGLLSTGMAHDFNNLLNRIKMSLDIILKISHDQTYVPFISEVNDAIQEGQSMTHSLLSFAKKEALELIPVNILSILKTFENKVRKHLTHLEIELNICCAPDINILSDPNHFNQILMNLFENSKQAFVKAPFKIELDVKIQDTFCNICFRDNGPGIPGEIQDHIFEPFYSTKVISKTSGWGLGLALVKSLVENMNGSITVKSIVNKGTEFILRFPIHSK